MFSPLRNRFGIPGVISVVALVFAMLGGAYAASSNDNGKATASAKAKKGPKGPKGATGPAGPAGAQGPAGPAGAKGNDGANGSNGSNGATGATGATGAAGQSVTTAVEPPFGECGDEEGVKLTSTSGSNYVCNGAKGATGSQGAAGSPWTAGGTLPVGSTETGAWSVTADKSEAGNPFGFIPVAIPFSVPLAAGIPVANTHYVTPGPAPAACEDPSHAGQASIGNPEASSGHFCVYEKAISGTTVTVPQFAAPDLLSEGTGTSGSLLIFSFGDADVGPLMAFGSWAVNG